MAYLRLFDGGHTKWFDPNPNLELLADKHLFSTKYPPDFSVFETSTPLEETQVAAAWRLSKGQNYSKNCFAIRIEPADISTLGFEVVKPRGEIGVEIVDARHGDLLTCVGANPTRDKLLALVRHIVEKFRTGEDRVRVFYTSQLVYQYESFLRGEAGALSPVAAKRCGEAANVTPPP